ncbi:hypothetical protein M405DRAFT_194421 [Rhizopogon salebrosus TDB-379]|nr:hypothetical protein M405DRAFT_194421 [Rhizopogon salebrosus TDB-379]
MHCHYLIIPSRRSAIDRPSIADLVPWTRQSLLDTRYRWLRRRLLWLHVLARSCRGYVARDRFQEESVGCCLGKLYKDKILMVGGRRGETVALGIHGSTAELRHILDKDV